MKGNEIRKIAITHLANMRSTGAATSYIVLVAYRLHSSISELTHDRTAHFRGISHALTRNKKSNSELSRT
jgi:hypothetical protein